MGTLSLDRCGVNGPEYTVFIRGGQANISQKSANSQILRLLPLF